MRNNSLEDLEPFEVDQIIEAAKELEQNQAWQFLSERLVTMLEMKIIHLRPEEFNKAPDYLADIQNLKRVLSFHKFIIDYKEYFGDVNE